MTAIKRHVVLYDASAAGNGDWIRLDTRYDQNTERAIQISMNAADSIALQGTTLDAKDANALSNIVTAADITTIQTYTGNSDENDILLGNYTYIRAVKTGTTANAKVQGYV